MQLETDPFRIRAHVAEFDDIVQEIVARSQASRANLPMVADIAYGSGPSETLDLFFPPAPRGGLPVHMFVHGGYWRMFSKWDYSYIADTVTGAGAIAVIVDYALMPSVRMADIVDQVQRAKSWVLENIASHGGDPGQLTISGHSAGAHLCSFLFHRAPDPTRVNAALLLGGLYELAPLQSSFLQPEIGLTDVEVADFSPQGHVHDAATRAMVLLGADETPPFHQQAAAFSALLREQGLEVRYEAIAEGNHMSTVRDLGLAGTAAAGLLAETIRVR